LVNLTQLYLRSNEITDLSPLSGLANLTQLLLWQNNISDLSPLSGLVNLTQLVLRENNITDLSPLSSLVNLTQLNLFRNQISDLSPLSGLVNLTDLNLFRNQISDLSPLSGLMNLTKLYLHDNQISDLSPLSGLVNLTQLLLLDNQITDLLPLLPLLQRKEPLQLVLKGSNATKEGEINVKDNPLQIPPVEIVEQGTESALRYFAELEKGEEKLLEAKVLLVGQGNSGKTSLKVKLLDPNDPMPPPDNTTRTIEIAQKEYPCQENKPLKINYWDFGGQNIQHFAHQFFLTGNALYILLSNDREQNPNFQYWLNIIELLGNNSQVLIVQNQKQGHAEDIKNAAGIRERFPNVVNPFHRLDISKVALEHRPQYDELVRAIVQHALAIPTVQRIFARSFVQVRQRLEELALQPQKHYITWDRYLAICQEEGLSEASATDYANAYTAVGICLHYPDHAQLRDYVFLRPKWIIDALFELLYSDDAKDGYLDSHHLRNIWQGEDYQAMRGNLLLLMELFELCYKVQDNEHLYIVPQRLPAAEEMPNIDKGVQMLYRYKFMPKGIITRLICKQKNKIVSGKVWNDAVFLSYRDETALVHEVFSENIIKVVASAERNSNLLNSIIDALDAIHQSFLDKGFNLQVDKLIPCRCNLCLDSNDPHYFDYNYLQDLMADGETQERCQTSRKYQDIRALLQSTKLNSRGRQEGVIQVFVSYAQEDREHLQTLKDQLDPLVRQKKLAIWYDQEILAGEDWNQEIEQHLYDAHVVLLLLSSDFIADRKKYIWEKEMPIIMEKQAQGQLVIPIVVRDCTWEWEEQLANIQAVNGGKPLNSAAKKDKDKAFANAARQIKAAIEVYRKS